MKITKEFIKALRRKKGELRITDKQLAEQTDLSIMTINKLLNGANKVVHDKTFNALSDWLFEKI